MLDAGLFFIFPDGFQNHTLLDADHDRGLYIGLLYDLTLTNGAVTISAGTEEMQILRSLPLGWSIFWRTIVSTRLKDGCELSRI